MGRVAATPDISSRRDIPASDRLIVPLDFSSRDDALRLVDSIEDTVSFFKVGLELFLATGLEVVQELQSRKHRVFLDMKMDDITETIFRAVRNVADTGVEFLTLHGSGVTAEAARKGRDAAGKDTPKLLHVTVLTSLNEADLEDVGILGPNSKFANLEEYVDYKALSALTRGCDGLISSGQNVARLRANEAIASRDPIIVCPGIRPQGQAQHDHKRPTTPSEAIKAGADYLVVGRPIRDSDDPGAAAQAIIEEIANALGP